MDGAHFVSIEKRGDDSYRVYNVGGVPQMDVSSIQEFVKKRTGVPVVMYGITRR